MKPTTNLAQLREFSRALLEPVTQSELQRELPDAFQRLVPASCWCEVRQASLDRGEALDSPSVRLCLPLRSEGVAFGAVLIGWNDSTEINPELEDLLSMAAELAATAIRSRAATDSERERVRAEAAEVKFDLIGMLAHEMRTPLASIKGYSSALLLDEVALDQETTVEFLRAIDEESDRLTEMVTHLLDSTVIEAGALELHREPILLQAVARRVVDAMAPRSGRHRIVTSFSSNLPAVYGDDQRIQQVLRNLIDNAIKYSPDGGLILVHGQLEGGEVLVQVSDQGVGIAPEHLNKLFERFFRTEQRRIHGVSGTGLGLPIADAIVRGHGGRIWAESVVDEGTTFSFTLPLARDGYGSGSDGSRTD